MPVCPQRTVQSINKFKQKNAENKRCVCPPITPTPPPCVVPTMSNITALLTQAGDSYSVTLTGSPTTVQWYYFLGSIFSSQPFVDNLPDTSGSQTTKLVLKTSFYNDYTIFCAARNPCRQDNTAFGSIQSGFYKIGCGPYPTVGNIIRSNCRPNEDSAYETRCDYTVQYSNGTSFQWYYGRGEIGNAFPFVDSPVVSGSQTPTITLNTSSNIECNINSFFCVVTNSCGSSVNSNSGLSVLAGCPQIS